MNSKHIKHQPSVTLFQRTEFPTICDFVLISTDLRVEAEKLVAQVLEGKHPTHMWHGCKKQGVHTKFSRIAANAFVKYFKRNKCAQNFLTQVENKNGHAQVGEACVLVLSVKLEHLTVASDDTCAKPKALGILSSKVCFQLYSEACIERNNVIIPPLLYESDIIVEWAQYAGEEGLRPQALQMRERATRGAKYQ